MDHNEDHRDQDRGGDRQGRRRPRYTYHYVRVHSDAGVCGTGEASHVDGGWRGSTRTMAQQLIGKDPRDVDACFEGIRRSYIFRGGYSGLGISALTGLEIALWDLAGKAQEVPVYRLLGGKFRDRGAALRRQRPLGL